jgi:hypothetical protein
MGNEAAIKHAMGNIGFSSLIKQDVNYLDAI